MTHDQIADGLTYHKNIAPYGSKDRIGKAARLCRQAAIAASMNQMDAAKSFFRRAYIHLTPRAVS